MTNLRILCFCITFMVCFSSTESSKKPHEMTFGENDLSGLQEITLILKSPCFEQNTINEQDSFYSAQDNEDSLDSQKYSTDFSNEDELKEKKDFFDLVPTSKQSTGEENFQFSDENKVQTTEEMTELIKHKLSSYFADKDFLLSGEKKNQPFISFKKLKSLNKKLKKKDPITSESSPPNTKTVSEIMNEKRRKNVENKSLVLNYSNTPKNPSSRVKIVKDLNVQSPRKISETLNNFHNFYPGPTLSPIPKTPRFSNFEDPKKISPEHNVVKSAGIKENISSFRSDENFLSKKFEVVESISSSNEFSDDEERYTYNSVVKAFLILNKDRSKAIAQNVEYEKLPPRPPSTQEIFNFVKDLPNQKKNSKKISKTLEKIYGSYPESISSRGSVKDSINKKSPSIFQPYIDKSTRVEKEIMNFENKDHGEETFFARKSEMMESYSDDELQNIQEQTASEIAYRRLNPDDESAFREHLPPNTKIEENHDYLTGTTKTIYTSNDKKILTRIQNAFGAIAILNHETQEVVVKGKDKENGGSALGKDLTQVKDIFATLGAFAALKENGGVEVFGNPALGGKLPECIEKEKLKIRKMISNKFGFAALLYDGTVISWGDLMRKRPILDTDKEEKIKDIVATSQAFAAHTKKDSVYTWGNIAFGGDKNDDELKCIELIAGSTGAFAVKLKPGSLIRKSNGQGNVFIWGDEDSLQEAEDNLKQLDVKSNLLNLLN